MGLRSLVFDDWQLSVNGERLFLKGANLAPTRALLGEATDDDLRRDVDLAREAGLDLLRIHAHVTRPEPSTTGRRAGDAALAGPAPSVGLRPLDPQAGRAPGPQGRRDPGPPPVGRHLVRAQRAPGPRRAHRRAGRPRRAAPGRACAPRWPWSCRPGTRPCSTGRSSGPSRRPTAPGRSSPTAASGPTSPASTAPTATSTSAGTTATSATCPASPPPCPAWSASCSEFGAQAVPETADFVEPERWPDLDWERLEAHHGLQTRVPRPPGAARPTTPPSTTGGRRPRRTRPRSSATTSRTLRRLKYRPTGGFAQFLLTDAQPAVTLVGARPRAGAQGRATRRCWRRAGPSSSSPTACPTSVAPGDALALDVHVVSDLRVPLVRAVGQRRADLARRRTARGTGAARSPPTAACASAGSTPRSPACPASLVLDLTLTAGDVTATNRYQTVIAPDPSRTSCPADTPCAAHKVRGMSGENGLVRGSRP